MMRKIFTAAFCSLIIVAGINYKAVADYAATAGSGLIFRAFDATHGGTSACAAANTQCQGVVVINSAGAEVTPATSGNQATNAATTAHTCSVAGYSELGCLGQIDDDVKTGAAATGAAVPAGAIYEAGLASSTEPTKATSGNLTGVTLDLAGKLVTSPFANRENQLACAVTITASTAATTCTGMGAQGAAVKIYITDLCVTRNDAGTTASTFTLNDGATTIIDLPNNGGGGGFCKTYNTPLVVAANTAFQGTSGTSLTSVHMSATGFKGY